MTENERLTSEITREFETCPYPAPAVYPRRRPKMSVDFTGIPAETIRLRDEYYMECALRLAAAAGEMGDVPVGALVVRENRIIGAAFNTRETDRNALCHAECMAISQACEVLGGWRLPGCELYVTLEPCIMCTGAIIQSRMPRVVFGCADTKAGALGGRFDAMSFSLGHTMSVACGVLAERTSAMMTEFFERKRTGVCEGIE